MLFLIFSHLLERTPFNEGELRQSRRKSDISQTFQQPADSLIDKMINKIIAMECTRSIILCVLFLHRSANRAMPTTFVQAEHGQCFGFSSAELKMVHVYYSVKNVINSIRISVVILIDQDTSLHIADCMVLVRHFIRATQAHDFIHEIRHIVHGCSRHPIHHCL